MFQKEGNLFALCLSFSTGPKCHQGTGRIDNCSGGLSHLVLISVLCSFLRKTCTLHPAILFMVQRVRHISYTKEKYSRHFRLGSVKISNPQRVYVWHSAASFPRERPVFKAVVRAAERPTLGGVWR